MREIFWLVLMRVYEGCLERGRCWLNLNECMRDVTSVFREGLCGSQRKAKCSMPPFFKTIALPFNLQFVGSI